MRLVSWMSLSAFVLGLSSMGCGSSDSYTPSRSQAAYYAISQKNVYGDYWVSNYECTDTDSKILSHLDKTVTLNFGSEGTLTYKEKVSQTCNLEVTYELDVSNDSSFTALKKSFQASALCAPEDAVDQFSNASVEISNGGKVLHFHGTKDCIAFGRNAY